MSANPDDDSKIVPFPYKPVQAWKPRHVPDRLLQDLLTQTPPPAKQRKAS
jgi:hypothetical protein